MKRLTSTRNANLPYPVAFFALLGGSLLLSGTSLGWRVVINELVPLGGPLMVYLLLTRGDIRETLRLRAVSWSVAGLSLLVGLALWRFDSWLAAVVNDLLDYTIPFGGSRWARSTRRGTRWRRHTRWSRTATT
jgi:hypothetical protein